METDEMFNNQFSLNLFIVTSISAGDIYNEAFDYFKNLPEECTPLINEKIKDLAWWAKFHSKSRYKITHNSILLSNKIEKITGLWLFPYIRNIKYKGYEESYNWAMELLTHNGLFEEITSQETIKRCLNKKSILELYGNEIIIKGD